MNRSFPTSAIDDISDPLQQNTNSDGSDKPEEDSGGGNCKPGDIVVGEKDVIIDDGVLEVKEPENDLSLDKGEVEKGDKPKKSRSKDGVANSYRCSVCGKMYSWKKNLKDHMRTHTDPMFNCFVCGKKFIFKEEFLSHLRTHPTEKKYACDICGKEFYSRSALPRHRRTHSEKRDFECTICGKTFHRKDRLTRHALCHSKLKPYQCESCHKEFKRKDDLKQHMRLSCKVLVS